MTAISSSPRNTTSRVWLRIAGMSDATKNSFSPRPTTIGGPLRTATIFSGSSTETSTIANMPRMSFSARRTAFSRPSLLHLALDEVRDDLRVGLGLELVALRLQLFLQLEVVLDDAVVHDDDAARAVAVRMRVLLGRAAVRGPARVAHAVQSIDRLGADGVLEVRRASLPSGGARCLPGSTSATPAES